MSGGPASVLLRWAALFCIVALAQQGSRGSPRPYMAAFYDSSGPRLVVFPEGRVAVAIPLPFALGRFGWSPEGRSLYTERIGNPRSPAPRELYRIQFGPTRVTTVPVSRVEPYNSIAISGVGEHLVVSGEYDDGPTRVCGVFEIAVAGDAAKKILSAEDACDYVSAWLSLSLAPNGKRFVAIHKHHLEVVDVDTGAEQLIGEGFLKAAWSPDGRWIAALENGGKWRTVLFSAVQLIKAKTLPTSEVSWSPDSRFLLRVSSQACRDGFGTFEMMNATTGESQPIRSSTCQVGQTTGGWVSREIVP